MLCRVQLFICIVYIRDDMLKNSKVLINFVIFVKCLVFGADVCARELCVELCVSLRTWQRLIELKMKTTDYNYYQLIL